MYRNIRAIQSSLPPCQQLNCHAFPLPPLKAAVSEKNRVLEDTIKRIGTTLGVPDAAKLTSEWNRKRTIAVTGAMQPGRYKFITESSLLIDESQIPSEFHPLHHPQPDFFHEKTRQKFLDWALDHLGLPRRETTIDDIKSFLVYQECLISPTKAQKMLRFIIGHELGHVVSHLDDIHQAAKQTTISNLWTAFNLLIFSLMIAFPIFGGAALLPFRAAIAGGSAIIGNLSFALYTNKHGDKNQELKQNTEAWNREIEKESDLFSCKQGKDVIEGGIEYFETLRKTSAIWRRRCLENPAISTETKQNIASMFNENGDPTNRTTHPTYSERIAYLQKRLYTIV